MPAPCWKGRPPRWRTCERVGRRDRTIGRAREHRAAVPGTGARAISAAGLRAVERPRRRCGTACFARQCGAVAVALADPARDLGAGPDGRGWCTPTSPRRARSPLAQRDRRPGRRTAGAGLARCRPGLARRTGSRSPGTAPPVRVQPARLSRRRTLRPTPGCSTPPRRRRRVRRPVAAHRWLSSSRLGLSKPPHKMSGTELPQVEFGRSRCRSTHGLGLPGVHCLTVAPGGSGSDQRPVGRVDRRVGTAPCESVELLSPCVRQAPGEHNP